MRKHCDRSRNNFCDCIGVRLIAAVSQLCHSAKLKQQLNVAPV